MNPKEKAMRTFILDVLEDCNIEQLETARSWAYDLFRREHLKTDASAHIISEALERRERDILRPKKKKEEHEKFILPHVKKRIKEIEDAQRRKIIKLVKAASSQ